MKALAIILLLLGCSCAARRTASETRTKIRRQETVYLREATVTGIAQTDSIREKLRRALTYKITYLSSPDTAGRQWPLSIEEGSWVEDFAAARLTARDSVVLLCRDTQTRRSLADDTQSTAQTSLSTRPFPPLLGWLLLTALAILALRFWQRHR